MTQYAKPSAIMHFLILFSSETNKSYYLYCIICMMISVRSSVIHTYLYFLPPKKKK